ncbi:unnamed protein product, partial [Ectocarpus fasciculatus]
MTTRQEERAKHNKRGTSGRNVKTKTTRLSESGILDKKLSQTQQEQIYHLLRKLLEVHQPDFLARRPVCMLLIAWEKLHAGCPPHTKPYSRRHGTNRHAGVLPNGAAAVGAKQTACARSACATRHFFYKVLKTDKIKHARQYDANITMQIKHTTYMGGPVVRQDPREIVTGVINEKQKQQTKIPWTLGTHTRQMYLENIQYYHKLRQLASEPLNKHTNGTVTARTDVFAPTHTPYQNTGCNNPRSPGVGP